MEQAARGHLKIFFSYTESSGKTCAMLKAAQDAKEQGLKVLVGYIAPHTTGEALSLLEGLEQLPLLTVDGRGELDLDEALRRRPDLLLVDEMAHANAAGCRHRCRYQDLDELIKSGVDVYTTVNVGNIESLHDVVASITGCTRWNRIPDSIFDHADQVELIDREPQEVMEILGQSDSPQSRMTLEQLTALREIAFRRCADRVRQLSDRLNRTSFHTDEHILACLSSAPSNGRIIRTAARMARAFHSQFTALFVETPAFHLDTAENKNRLQENQRLAEQLGATIEVVHGEDVPYQIAEYARLSGVTKIVLGRSAMTRRHPFSKPPLTEQLLTYVPEMDIHIIPDTGVDASFRPRRSRPRARQILENLSKSLAVLLGTTALSLVFDHMGFTQPNLIMVYILGVLLTSIVTTHRIYSLFSAVAGVVIFNLLFTEPRFSLMAYDTGYPVTFAVMFLTAYFTGTLATRYKEQAGQSAKIAYRTKVLFETDKLLSKAQSRDEILLGAGQQIARLLDRNIVMFQVQEGELSEPCLCGDQDYDFDRERETVEWVMRHNHAAGATTDTHAEAAYLYLAIRASDRVYGVVGIEAARDPLDSSENSILLSMLGECALALENERNAREKEAAAILAESEQLRANLLRTISHDLRTPLTTISGNASSLLSNGHAFDEATKRQLYRDIYSDAMWLNNLVENLLSATRIEEGHMTLRTSTELLSDIVEEAVSHVRQRSGEHRFVLGDQEELLFVRADAHLMAQVLVNLLDNAVKYTPAGSTITVTTAREGELARISVADNGPGIPKEEKTRIFDKFYCGSHKIADNRRSLGLGLYLCKAIVEAHGGTIRVTDHEPTGAVFSLTLPLQEVTIHE